MRNKIFAELFGTALLLAVVTGSGVMGASLAAGNNAVALLGNSIATGCGLYVLITVLGPISGAHFNPLVSLMMWQANVINLKNAIGYISAQCIGAILGVWLTHLMFGLSLIEVSSKPRNGVGQWLSELVSTMILLTLIRLALKYASEKVAMLIAMTVTAGYWFTSSTFFANPAVTIARTLTDTFVGIAPADLLLFISAQFVALLFTVFWMKLEAK
ncbi:MAG TPA: aquaporin family protein [Methylophilaceae bacterium]|nr:aquaporin family protein [Methylophilaceae bacterium]